VGSADGGSTRTDSLELERRRGITIRSAVVSFVVGDTTVHKTDRAGADPDRVVPERPEQAGTLHAAPTRPAEQDPLIELRQDDGRREVAVALYGEVQKEVIAAEPAGAGPAVTFRETTAPCLEHPVGGGEDVAVIGADDNPHLVTVGLRVDPAPAGSGVRFRLGVEAGSVPHAFFAAVEESVRDTLRRGGVHGRQVLAAVSPVPAGPAAAPRGSVVRDGVCVLEGDIPAARVHRLRLPGLTRGEGVLETAFSHHSPVPGRRGAREG